MSTQLQHPIIIPPEAGRLWEVLGTLIECKIDSEETGGAYAIVEAIVPPQGGPPAHVHHNEDEIFHVLEGEFEVRCGAETLKAMKGATVVLPRDIPHSFRNVGAGEGKLLTTITPGGFEQFFAEVSREVRNMPADAMKLMEIARKYDVDFLG
ncbi:MAG: cupin domain-containing protein [Pyrinomonadaceae bacterium]